MPLTDDQITSISPIKEFNIGDHQFTYTNIPDQVTHDQEIFHLNGAIALVYKRVNEFNISVTSERYGVSMNTETGEFIISHGNDDLKDEGEPLLTDENKLTVYGIKSLLYLYQFLQAAMGAILQFNRITVDDFMFFGIRMDDSVFDKFALGHNFNVELASGLSYNIVVDNTHQNEVCFRIEDYEKMLSDDRNEVNTLFFGALCQLSYIIKSHLRFMERHGMIES